MAYDDKNPDKDTTGATTGHDTGEKTPPRDSKLDPARETAPDSKKVFGGGAKSQLDELEKEGL